MMLLTRQGAQVEEKDQTVTCTSMAGLSRRRLQSARMAGTGRQRQT